MFRKVLREAAKRAGVTKPVTITNFRKSSASYLASQNMDQAHIEDHHGWTRGSGVASRYVAVSEVILTVSSPVHTAWTWRRNLPIQSLRPSAHCQRETPRHEEFCVWYGQALEPGADTM